MKIPTGGNQITGGIGKASSLPVYYTAPDGTHWHCQVSNGQPVALSATKPKTRDIKKGGFMGWFTNWPKDDLYLSSLAADPLGFTSFTLDIWRACQQTLPPSIKDSEGLEALEGIRDYLAGRAGGKKPTAEK